MKYQKNGKTKSIKGKSKPQNSSNTRFKWRGNCFLALITSKWQDSYIDKEEQWAIIYFENTLFTPEGYDVISKQKQLISELEKQVDSKLKELNITEQLETIEQE